MKYKQDEYDLYWELYKEKDNFHKKLEKQLRFQLTVVNKFWGLYFPLYNRLKRILRHVRHVRHEIQAR